MTTFHEVLQQKQLLQLQQVQDKLQFYKQKLANSQQACADLQQQLAKNSDSLQFSKFPIIQEKLRDIQRSQRQNNLERIASLAALLKESRLATEHLLEAQTRDIQQFIQHFDYRVLSEHFARLNLLDPDLCAENAGLKRSLQVQVNRNIIRQSHVEEGHQRLKLLLDELQLLDCKVAAGEQQLECLDELLRCYAESAQSPWLKDRASGYLGDLLQGARQYAAAEEVCLSAMEERAERMRSCLAALQLVRDDAESLRRQQCDTYAAAQRAIGAQPQSVQPLINLVRCNIGSFAEYKNAVFEKQFELARASRNCKQIGKYIAERAEKERTHAFAQHAQGAFSAVAAMRLVDPARAEVLASELRLEIESFLK